MPCMHSGSNMLRGAGLSAIDVAPSAHRTACSQAAPHRSRQHIPGCKSLWPAPCRPVAAAIRLEMAAHLLQLLCPSGLCTTSGLRHQPLQEVASVSCTHRSCAAHMAAGELIRTRRQMSTRARLGRPRQLEVVTRAGLRRRLPWHPTWRVTTHHTNATRAHCRRLWQCVLPISKFALES